MHARIGIFISFLLQHKLVITVSTMSKVGQHEVAKLYANIGPDVWDSRVTVAAKELRRLSSVTPFIGIATFLKRHANNLEAVVPSTMLNREACHVLDLQEMPAQLWHEKKPPPTRKKPSKGAFITKSRYPCPVCKQLFSSKANGRGHLGRGKCKGGVADHLDSEEPLRLD